MFSSASNPNKCLFSLYILATLKTPILSTAQLILDLVASCSPFLVFPAVHSPGKTLQHRVLFEQNEKHMQPPKCQTSVTFWVIVPDTEKTFLNYRHCARFPENPSIQYNSFNIKGNGNGRHMLFSTSIDDPVSCRAEWEQTRPAMSWLNICWADENQMKDFTNCYRSYEGEMF